MNIDMNSWHYRLNKKFLNVSGAVPESLCPYFWSTVGRLSAVGFALAAITTMFFVVGFASFMAIHETSLTNIISTALASAEITVWMYPIIVFVGAFMLALCLGLLFGILLLLVAISTGVSMLGQKYKGLSVKQRIDSSDNLVISYIRAKHRKICPKINFSYGEKK